MKSNRISTHLILALIIFTVLFTACDNGDEVSVVPTAENTPTTEPTATPTDEPTETPLPTDTPTPEPTDKPEPTDTPTPTHTPEPTDTPEPTNTAQPTAIPPTAAATTAATIVPTATTESTGGGTSDFPLPIPSGAPASEWNGLPIMPQAIAGQEGSGSYSYTVGATTAEIQDYYLAQMPPRGWSFLAATDGQNGATLMIFQNAGETASVSIFELDANTRYVFLVR